MNTRNISFSEKKVSKNAVITLVMGIIILIGFVILTILVQKKRSEFHKVIGWAWTDVDDRTKSGRY